MMVVRRGGRIQEGLPLLYLATFAAGGHAFAESLDLQVLKYKMQTC